MGAPVGVERGTVLTADAVALEVLVVGIGDLAVADEGADLERGGAIDLVHGELERGEVTVVGVNGRQAHVATKGSLVELELLGLRRVLPRGGAAVRPVHTVEARLDLHLKHGAGADRLAFLEVGARPVAELVELVCLAVVDGHGLALSRVITGVEHLAVEVAVVESLHLRVGGAVGPNAARELGRDRGRGVAPRVLEGDDRDFLAPLGEALGGALADLHLMGAVVRLVGHVERGDGLLGGAGGHAVDGAVDHELIARGALDGVPAQAEARGRQVAVLLGRGLEGRDLELVVLHVRVELAVVLEAGDLEGLDVLLDVGLGELHVQLGRGEDLLAGEALLLDRIGGVGGGTVVEVRLRVVEVDELAVLGLGLVELLLRLDLDLLERGIAVLGHDGRRLLRDVHHKRGGVFRRVPLVAARGLLRREGGHVALDARLVRGGHMVTVVHVVLGAVLLVLGLLEIGVDEDAVVLELRVAVLARRGEELHVANGAIDVLRVVVGLVHRDDGVGLDEHRELPQRRIEVVEHLAAAVLLAGEVVDPDGVVQRGAPRPSAAPLERSFTTRCSLIQIAPAPQRTCS